MKQPLPTTASNFDIDSALTTLGNPFQYTDIGTLISKVLEFLMILGAITALLFLVWGGFEWITSAGDKQGTEKAKSRITDSIIGLIVLFSAWTIFQVLQVFLGVDVAEKTLVSGKTGTGGTTSSAKCDAAKIAWVRDTTNRQCATDTTVNWTCWENFIKTDPCKNFNDGTGSYWPHKNCGTTKPTNICP